MSQAVVKARPANAARLSPILLIFSCVLAATLAALAWVAHELSDPTALPIRRVQIEGEFVHLEPQYLQDVVSGAVDAGFFRVDVARVRNRLLDEPWIREATIRRIWPETLRVAIVEQEPVARWGEHTLLNSAGELFAPPADTIPAGLVQLDGPLGFEDEVLARYRALSTHLGDIDLDIVEMRLSARHAWTLFVRGGKEVELGRRDLERRVERFVYAYRRGLSEAWPRIARIDLRYPNGFAVSERPGEPPGAAPGAAPTG